MEEKIKMLESKFIQMFGVQPVMVKSPGRINLIGEHTDYNMGFVLPAAIDKCAYVAIAESGTDESTLVALDLDEVYKFSNEDELSPTDTSWANYFLGVIHEFRKKGLGVKGFNMLFTSDIPIGAGLSSSAAIESSFAFALDQLFTTNYSRLELALIGQAAEHHFVGVKCGIMDQFASCFGKKRNAMLLDCRSLEHTYVSADLSNYQLILFDSQVRHNLAESEYNTRRDQCQSGVDSLKKKYKHINSLREVTMEQLDQAQDELTPTVYLRCKYVLEENWRVLDACEALKNQDMQQLGGLIFASHQGLAELYEASCDELDLLVSLSRSNEYIIGARMMGGGFGGCTINLIKKSHLEDTISWVKSEYYDQTQIKASHYKVDISDGVTRLQNRLMVDDNKG